MTIAAVTGAGGFIGSHLVELLVERGFEVRALVHYNSAESWGNLDSLPADLLENVQVMAGEITDERMISGFVEGSDVVFHLAALIGIPYSYVAPQHYVNTNIGGTLNVLEACRRYDVPRLVHTSTSEAYGTAQYTPIDEQHPLCAQSPYAATKISADKLVESYWRSFDLPVTTIRPFNNFGPRQSARAIIPTIISQALWRPHLELGSLEPIRDHVYVKDTVHAFVDLAQCDQALGKTVNFGAGIGRSIRSVAEMIQVLLETNKEIVATDERTRPQASEVMELICDYTLAQDMLGWKPRHSFEDGLRETIEWVRSNQDQFKTHRYTI